MSNLTIDFLKHILGEVNYLLDETSEMSFNDFVHDETLKRACIRSLEVVGEAVKNLPKDLIDKHSDVKFKNAARMRDRLIHGYFDVDYSIIWQVVKHDIPILKKQINLIIEDFEKGK